MARELPSTIISSPSIPQPATMTSPGRWIHVIAACALGSLTVSWPTVN